MAPTKKEKDIKGAYKSPFKKGEEGIKSNPTETLAPDEIKNVQKMVELIGSGKQNGIVVVLEEFSEGGRRGIQGRAFVHGIGPTERVQALVPAMGMPRELAMVIMSMMKD